MGKKVSVFLNYLQRNRQRFRTKEQNSLLRFSDNLGWLSTKFVTFATMKVNINWKHFLLLFIVIGGLYYITRSILITCGIMAILLLIDGLLMQYEHRKRGEREIEEITRKINEEEEEA